MTLDNLRVPFMTDGKFKILSFRSKDTQFKPDPGVVPDAEQCEKAGITVVDTGFQHNDMRDTGPDAAKNSIQSMLDKFLGDPTASSRRSIPRRRRSASRARSRRWSRAETAAGRGELIVAGTERPARHDRCGRSASHAH